MKKRTVALVMALVLSLSLGLTACTNSDDQPTQEPTQSLSPAPSPSDSAAPENTTPAESDSDTDATDDPGDMTGDQDTTLTVEIEGETETIPGIRHNSVLGYAVTYDPERFALNIVDEYAESYMADIVEGQPNVYLAVSVIEDELDELTIDDVVEGMRIQQNIEDEGTTVSVGAHSYAATYLRYAAGTEDNDEIVEYYITEQNGTIFVVALGYFVGAEEGYGARLHAMLDTMTF